LIIQLIITMCRFSLLDGRDDTKAAPAGGRKSNEDRKAR
jgi:hypothetical protein